MSLATLRSLSLASAALAVLTLGGCHIFDHDDDGQQPPTGGLCVDFEDPAAGTTYTVGQSFQDNGITVSVLPFQWANGTMTSGGSANIDTNNYALGTGNAGRPNNTNFGFGFGRVNGVTLKLGELGGNNNIKINSDFRNFANFADIDGQTIGGATVDFTATSAPGAHNYYGTLSITGVVEVFEIGGQELWVDDVCAQP